VAGETMDPRHKGTKRDESGKNAFLVFVFFLVNKGSNDQEVCENQSIIEG
jgi:hypothetical protein